MNLMNASGGGEQIVTLSSVNLLNDSSGEQIATLTASTGAAAFWDPVPVLSFYPTNLLVSYCLQTVTTQVDYE